jgi:hypothetical protein
VLIYSTTKFLLHEKAVYNIAWEFAKMITVNQGKRNALSEAKIITTKDPKEILFKIMCLCDFLGAFHQQFYLKQGKRNNETKFFRAVHVSR